MTASRPLELFTPSFSASGLSPEQISSKKDFFLGGEGIHKVWNHQRFVSLPKPDAENVNVLSST